MQLNLRLLWPKGKNGLAAEEIGIRALDLGYNGVVSTTYCKGISWIKPIAALDAIGEKPDYFLWSSRWKDEDFFHRPGNERWTRAEIVALEMEEVEKAIPKSSRLIFVLPGEEKIEWVYHLAKMTGPKTCLAFSPYFGEPICDFLPPQVLWRKVVEGEEFCGTPLLPILNTGMVDQGGGLWPTLPFDLFDRFYGQIPSLGFNGAIALTPTIPKGAGFLHCALWVGARLLQQEVAPDKRVAEWFYKFRNEFDYFKSALLLRNLRTLALETTVLKHLKGKKLGNEESRALLEGLHSKLQALQYSIEQECVSLLDPFIFFARDVRRSMSYFASQHNVSYSTHPDEALDSFWTLKSGSKVSFLSEPNRGAPGSKQESIFMDCWG